MIVGLCRWIAGKLGYIAWRLQAAAEIRERWWQTLGVGDRRMVRLSALAFAMGIAGFVAYSLGVALGGSAWGALGFLIPFYAVCLFFSAFWLTALSGTSLNRRLRDLRNFYYAMGGLPPTTETGREIFQRRFEQQLGRWENVVKNVWGSMAAITQRLENLREVETDNLPDAIERVGEAEAELRIEQEKLGRIKRRLEQHVSAATSPHLYFGIGVGLRVPENIEGLIIGLTSPLKK
ncbi:MAG: hypothetical protein A3H71_03375 [Candidatus Sungbacteria bacterium RIFCSPLOWO2_02_FULL_48_13b]|uniref:Uncharacterized protein n=1 Tax=Candidatus Sungbacteria bacterium RIFCSPLOWO2_02_FULL_48_13b TaxID=1802283 RepID=A0A1G2LH75_9BACT|nr:MAG: hypothetical protein A3H71_03375 [Candidatus Sungbacteria bacterium RIFCSPLOWO2_02_FULL_48_13b]